MSEWIYGEFGWDAGIMAYVLNKTEEEDRECAKV